MRITVQHVCSPTTRSASQSPCNISLSPFYAQQVQMATLTTPAQIGQDGPHRHNISPFLPLSAAHIIPDPVPPSRRSATHIYAYTSLHAFTREGSWTCPWDPRYIYDKAPKKRRDHARRGLRDSYRSACLQQVPGCFLQLLAPTEQRIHDQRRCHLLLVEEALHQTLATNARFQHSESRMLLPLSIQIHVQIGITVIVIIIKLVILMSIVTIILITITMISIMIMIMTIMMWWP